MGEICQLFKWPVMITGPLLPKLGDEDFAEVAALSD